MTSSGGGVPSAKRWQIGIANNRMVQNVTVEAASVEVTERGALILKGEGGDLIHAFASGAWSECKRYAPKEG